MGRDQRRTIAKDNALEQKRITRQMILRAQVDFVSTFFEGLLSFINFTLEGKRQILTRSIRGSWKLKYS